MRSVALAWAVGLVAVSIVTSWRAPVPSAAAAVGPNQVTGSAADVYLQNCASCHGPQGEGAPAGPPLIGVGEASADFYLRTGRMPLGAPGQQPMRQEPRLEPAEIDALVALVGRWGDGPAIPQVTAGGDVRRGWELYQANCAACHAASGSGNAIGGGAVAVGLGHATPVQVAEAMLIGPGVMPRFELPPEDRDAVVAYVGYLQTAPNPGGAPIGGFGPVSEGFVAVVIGLFLVLLAVRFVGRRSHEGEPEDPGPDTDPATHVPGSGPA
jgi:ubiquinol-cytochrome c reductase cytochrome c subunit